MGGPGVGSVDGGVSMEGSVYNSLVGSCVAGIFCSTVVGGFNCCSMSGVDAC